MIGFDLVCFSHLHWRATSGRHRELLGRAAREHRVFFIEEPTFGAGEPRLDVEHEEEGVTLVMPRLTAGTSPGDAARELRPLLDQLLARYHVRSFALWYSSPSAMSYSRHLRPIATLYDCGADVTSLPGDPVELTRLEAELLRRADLVLTPGQSLHEVLSHMHHNVQLLPSAADQRHFATARHIFRDPLDQARIPYPRAGYFGPIDHRFDLALLDKMASLRPDVHFILVGPIVRVDVSALARHSNIHWLGSKRHAELPAYVAGWDVGILPLVRDDATRYFCTVKPAAYLAAGKPVVATSIPDVVHAYGENGLARIADSPLAFLHAIDAALIEDGVEHRLIADAALSQTTWDAIWRRMKTLVETVVGTSAQVAPRRAVPSHAFAKA